MLSFEFFKYFKFYIAARGVGEYLEYGIDGDTIIPLGTVFKMKGVFMKQLFQAQKSSYLFI